MAEVFALFAHLLGVEDAQGFFAGEDGGEAVGAFCAGEHAPAVAATTLAIPYTPFSAAFGFVSLPLLVLGLIGLIVLGYIVSTELAKR